MRWLAILLFLCACRTHRRLPEPTPESPRHFSLRVDGWSRTLHVWEPSGEGPYPLLLSLHGRYGTGEAQEKLTNASRLATQAGVLVVAPDGYEKSWADARGQTPASRAGVDDVHFLSTLIDEMIANHHADPDRVYVMGMSNGAMMSLTLACPITNRLAGVVAVAGQMTPPLVETCHPTRPLPVAFILGTRDPLVPYGGGGVGGGGGEVLPADTSAQFWAKANGCGEPARTELPDADPADETKTSVETWSHCQANTEVRLYTVTGGGHTWPGGWQYLGKWIIGRTSQDFSATDEAWRFLQGHRRR